MSRYHFSMQDAATGRHHALDLLRGLAALGIASYHFLFYVPKVHLEALGTFGVYLFFVLSAVTMMMVYARGFSAAIAFGQLRSFYWHRISRIVPLLAAVAAINFVIAIVLAAPSTGLAHIGKLAFLAAVTGTGLMALHLPGYLSNAMGAWSLGIEMFFYIVFPVVCLLAVNTSIRILAAIIVALLAAQHGLLALLWLSWQQPALWWHLYITPLTFAPFFGFGILIYRLGGEQRGWNIVWALAAMAAIVAFSAVDDAEIMLSNADYIMLSGVAVLAVAFAYRSRVPAALIAPATFLGNISYSLYLTHPFSLRLALKIAKAFSPLGALDVVVLGAAYFLCCVSGAYLCFIFFERPVRDMLRGRSATVALHRA